jgi:hypothetical protein
MLSLDSKQVPEDFAAGFVFGFGLGAVDGLLDSRRPKR